MSGEARLVLRLSGDGVAVAGCLEERVCRALEERGYLRGGLLDPFEAGYMLARCTARLEEGGCGWVEALRAAGLGGAAEMFLVYFDLRRRGRIVRRGIRRGTLLVYKGGVARVEVRVLVEGSPVSIGDLIEWSRTAAGDGKEPVIAVVSGHGDVTYYSARAVTSFR